MPDKLPYCNENGLGSSFPLSNGGSRTVKRLSRSGGTDWLIALKERLIYPEMEFVRILPRRRLIWGLEERNKGRVSSCNQRIGIYFGSTSWPHCANPYREGVEVFKWSTFK